MAVVKKMPLDDVLREFRIRALTTPPAAVEMTKLDRKMSSILSRTDLSKEAKMKMYDQALNEFRTMRDIAMNIERPDVKQAVASDVQKQDWNFDRETDKHAFFEMYKDYVRKTLMEDVNNDVYFEKTKLGTAEDVMRGVHFLLNDDHLFLKNNDPDYMKNVPPELLQTLAEVAEELFTDLKIPRSQWRAFVPRVARHMAAVQPQSAAHGENGLDALLDTLAVARGKHGSPSSTRKRGRTRGRRGNAGEVTPVQMSPASASAPVALNTRQARQNQRQEKRETSLFDTSSPVQPLKKKERKARSPSMTNKRGSSGIPRPSLQKSEKSVEQKGSGYHIDFEGWEQQLKKKREQLYK
jgi:hypothetical protein